ncbi:hypothetical protein K9001_004536 [Salmonella enterica]|nr:hypothetical protein [Salmonella enterica]EIC6911810.1 hypothetical protein [Salmonella enterica subsp. enterica serovar Infantis]
MKYALYEAVDNRDGKPMLWLHDTANHRVAVFFIKTAPSRIKQRTASAPEGIVWEDRYAWLKHADGNTEKLIDSWSFQS